MGGWKSQKRGGFSKNEEKRKTWQDRGIEPWSPAWKAGMIATQPWGWMKEWLNFNNIFLPRYSKKGFKLQVLVTFPAINENFLSLALSEAMCRGQIHP